jgi:hypothetical protein
VKAKQGQVGGQVDGAGEMRMSETNQIKCQTKERERMSKKKRRIVGYTEKERGPRLEQVSCS